MKAKVVYVAVLALAVLGVSAGVSQLKFPHASAQTAAVQPSVQTLPDFAAIVEANRGAVVNITATSAAKPTAATPELPEEFRRSPFREFWPHQTPQPNVPRQGMGSGFI